jgi:hypothetical protein
MEIVRGNTLAQLIDKGRCSLQRHHNSFRSAITS